MPSQLLACHAPITWTVGFMEVTAARAAESCLEWRRELAGKTTEPFLRNMEQSGASLISRTALFRTRRGRIQSNSCVAPKGVPRHQISRILEPLPKLLDSLQPLSRNGGERELFVTTSSQWTAYFDNGFELQERIAPVMVLCGRLQCKGLVVTCIPDTNACEGSVQFQLIDPHPAERVRFVRSVYATKESGRWVFGTNGTELPFEETETYSRARVRDRFTFAMLGRYCHALGIRFFDPTFYEPDGFLISMGSGTSGMNFREAQELLGLDSNGCDPL